MLLPLKTTKLDVRRRPPGAAKRCSRLVEKATGDVLHGTAPHENWRPSGEFWYNPMTGATSRVSPVHEDGKTNDDEGNDNYNDIRPSPH